MELAEDVIVHCARVLETNRQKNLTPRTRPPRLDTIVKPFPRIITERQRVAAGRVRYSVAENQEWGGDVGTMISEIREAGDGASLSGGDEGLLHEADPENPKIALGVDVLAPKDTAR